jgi:hypothetical protein
VPAFKRDLQNIDSMRFSKGSTFLCSKLNLAAMVTRQGQFTALCLPPKLLTFAQPSFIQNIFVYYHAE